MCGQRTKVKTAHFPGHKVLLVREIRPVLRICTNISHIFVRAWI